MLERLCVLRGEAPLVLAHDGGSETVHADIAAWAERRRVNLLRNRPHTPQHNPWVERKHGEVRGVSGQKAKERRSTNFPSARSIRDRIMSHDRSETGGACS